MRKLCLARRRQHESRPRIRPHLADPMSRSKADVVSKGAFEGDFGIYYYDRNGGQRGALAEQCGAEGGYWLELD